MPTAHSIHLWQIALSWAIFEAWGFYCGWIFGHHRGRKGNR